MAVLAEFHSFERCSNPKLTMTREEQLVYCKQCQNRKLDPKQGLVCSLTNEKAAFEGTCPDFKKDDSISDEPLFAKGNDEAGNILLNSLPQEYLERLQMHENLAFAAIGGLFSAILSGILWAVITVTTEFQIGYMAVAVGFIVGYAVGFFGAGTSISFSFVGAICAFLGCLLGNLFSQIGFIAKYEDLSVLETLSLLDMNIIIEVMAASFHPMDILFYGIAVYEGFRFSQRKVDDQLLENMRDKNYDAAPPANQFRFPAVIAAGVLLGALVFIL